jgi:hypothetical protein
LTLPFDATAAAPLNSGWLVGGNRTPQLFQAFFVSHDTAPQLFLSYSSASDRARFRLTVARNAAIIATNAVYPFETLAISSTRAVDTLTTLDYDGNEPDDFARREGVFSLPAVPLDCGYLQMLVDVRSDERRVILLTPDGHVNRRMKLFAPLGLVGAVGVDRLLGVLTAGRYSDIVEFAIAGPCQSSPGPE